jgi:hypothetical protein
MDNDAQEDPFEVLLKNVDKILGVLEQSQERATAAVTKRAWQVKRVRRALRALRGTGSEGRTQAQIEGTKQASATRLKNRNATLRSAEQRHQDREEAAVG